MRVAESFGSLARASRQLSGSRRDGFGLPSRCHPTRCRLSDILGLSARTRADFNEETSGPERERAVPARGAPTTDLASVPGVSLASTGYRRTESPPRNHFRRGPSQQVSPTCRSLGSHLGSLQERGLAFYRSHILFITIIPLIFSHLGIFGVFFMIDTEFVIALQ